MRKNCASLLALATVVVYSSACITWSKKDVKTLAEPPAENTPILSVVKASGEVVQFSKADPGRVHGYTIVGTARDPLVKQVDIEGPFSLIKMGSGQRITGVTDGKGQAYAVEKVLSRDGNRMTILASERESVSIPLADASVIEVQRHNALTITAVVLGGLVVVPTLGYLLVFAVGHHRL